VSGLAGCLEDLLRSEGLHVVASCLGESTGGGLLTLTPGGSGVEVLDRISTTGLYVHGDHLLRTLWCKDEYHPMGELLLYDERGVLRYGRVDALQQAHDVLVHRGHWVCVSTGTNSIVWMKPGGQVVRELVLPGGPDAWHLNSLYVDGDQLLACAFGRFPERKGWRADLQAPTGIVFDPETGADVLTGLVRPHHPRRWDSSSWIVCNSGKRELLQVSEQTGEVLRRKELGQWTRGLALSARYIFVGGSARRGRVEGDGEDAVASITVLHRETWETVGSIALPFEEVYDLVLLPPALVRGLRNGFRTNPHRALESDQHALFQNVGVQPPALWATGERIAPEQCRVELTVDVDETLRSDRWAHATCAVRNRSNRILVSAKPHPIYISYRWVLHSTGEPIEDTPVRTRLPRALPPGELDFFPFRLRTPTQPGEYLLHVSLAQGEHFWGDLHSSNLGVCPVRIT
jgi:hypothetical protein